MGKRVEPQELMATVLPVIGARHERAWLVGGWVRDRLLGLETHDYDFVVPSGAIATARAVADALSGPFVVLDVERDTARVLVGPAAETYLDFAGLRAPDIGADLLGRDFTINAMAVPVDGWAAPERAVIDPAGGRRDLRLRLLRAVSADSFREDPLRMLRAVRLSASLGFRLESQTAAWIERDAELLEAVSRERVRDELAQMLVLPRAAESLRQLDRLGLLQQVLPEVARLRAVALGNAGPRDALEHSLGTVEAMEALRGWAEGQEGAGQHLQMLTATLALYRTRLAEHLAGIVSSGRSVGMLLSLAALLHDTGKGPTEQEEAPPANRLLGHEVLGASISAMALRRLCFSSAEVVRVRLAVRGHVRPGEFARQAEIAPSRRAVHRFFRDSEPAGVDAILLSLADHWAARGSALEPEAWQRHLDVSSNLLRAYYEQRQEVVNPTLVLDGHELMSSLDLRPGPEVGRLLESIREAQAAGEVRTRDDALALAQRLLERGGPL